jgi:mxaK protein
VALTGRTLLAPRHRIRAVLAALALCVATAAIAGMSWWRTERNNAKAMAGGVTSLPPERVMESPQLRFAKAQELASAEDFEGALALYRTLFSDPLLGVDARYNQANLLMRQGLRNRDGAEVGQAIALVELAKQGYRAVLRIEPLHWDARYNLERALRLQPDPEEDAAAIGGPRNDAERAPITLRGIPQGLP